MLRVISMLLLVLGIIITGVGIVLSLSDMTMAVIVKWRKEMRNLMEIDYWPAEKVLKTNSELEFGMFLFCLFFIVMGPILIHNGIASDPVDWKAILASSCMLAIAVLYLSRIIPYLGKPACELSRGGFFTPRYGFTPWHRN